MLSQYFVMLIKLGFKLHPRNSKRRKESGFSNFIIFRFVEILNRILQNSDFIERNKNFSYRKYKYTFSVNEEVARANVFNIVGKSPLAQCLSF